MYSKFPIGVWSSHGGGGNSGQNNSVGVNIPGPARVEYVDAICIDDSVQ